MGNGRRRALRLGEDGVFTGAGSGIFEAGVEVAAETAEEEEGEWEGGGDDAGGEGFGFPTLVEAVVEDDQEQGENADKADEETEGHNDTREGGAFALASETGRAVSEAGHVLGELDCQVKRDLQVGVNRKGGRERWLFARQGGRPVAIRGDKVRGVAGIYCRRRMVAG